MHNICYIYSSESTLRCQWERGHWMPSLKEFLNGHVDRVHPFALGEGGKNINETSKTLDLSRPLTWYAVNCIINPQQ